MSDEARSEDGQSGQDAYPDSPVRRVEIEHMDGTVKSVENEEARKWVSWVDGGVGLRVVHGESAPEIDWEVRSR